MRACSHSGHRKGQTVILFVAKLTARTPFKQLQFWSFPLQRVVRAYAARLLARLPKTAAGGTAGTPTAHTTDWYVKLGEEDLAVAAVIIATAEYCGEVVAALARNVGKLLESPLGEQVCGRVKVLGSGLGSDQG